MRFFFNQGGTCKYCLFCIQTGLGSITLKSYLLNYNYIAICSIKLQLQGIIFQLFSSTKANVINYITITLAYSDAPVT